jgi:DNA/RNA endonuclease YhcR with UshA esterase domain
MKMHHIKKNSWFAPVLVALITAMAMLACVKTQFDEPPYGNIVVNVRPNLSILALKNYHVTPGGYDSIPGDYIIAGTVVLDDRSGNYYKTLVIQDSTGGIEVKFNDGYLYTSMPVGRTIYIRLKGLILSDYNGLTQLIGSVIEEAGVKKATGLTLAQVREKVVKGNYSDKPPVGKPVFINALNDNMISTLIQLNDVEFVKADTGRTYADAVALNSVNRTLEDCSGHKLLLRSSGYANFAASLTPGKKGVVTGVLSVYNGTYQFTIRDLTDVNMTDDRCGGGVFNTLNESFDGAVSGQDLDLPGWTTYPTVGTRKWRGATNSGNLYAQATAFGTTNPDPTNEMWLVTPPINVSTQKTLNFKSSWSYYVHQGLTAWYSTDFSAQNPTAAHWTQINCTIAQKADGSGNFGNWVPSGNVSLPVIPSGKLFIGFKYNGDKATNNTNWRVDDVVVQ